MKAIIINNTNKEKIISIIDAAQARARERKITYKDILKAIKEIESKLGITKKALEGTRASVDVHAQDFARAYRFRAESTHFKIIYEKKSWRLISVSRKETRGRLHTYEITLSDTAKAAILDNASRLA